MTKAPATRDSNSGAGAINAAGRLMYAASIAVFAFLLVRHHHTIITMPIPLDLYEGAMPFITSIIASGGNPYTSAFQPQAVDVYPPLYNMVVAPLTLLFANSLELHRAVSAFFIWLTGFMFWFATWRQSRSVLDSSAAMVAICAGLLFYSTPVASTNALGVFLFSATVIVPWWAGFTRKSLLVAALCGLLAFFTKQYFILGIAIVALHLALYVSVANALALGFGFSIALLGSLAIVHWTSPYFLDNTLFSPSIAINAVKQWPVLLLQLHDFVRIYAGYLVIALVLVARDLRRRKGGEAPARSDVPSSVWNWSWHRPLLTDKVDYFWFVFWSATITVIYALGRNPGNYMTYLFQLMSPFLLVAVFSNLAKVTAGRWWTLPLVLCSFYQAYTYLPRDFSFNEDKWRRMEQLVRGADQILGSRMLVMMLLRNGKEVHQNGHTLYFPMAAGKPRIFTERPGYEPVESLWTRYLTELYRKIERREFDLVIVDTWEMLGVFKSNPPPQSHLDGISFLKKYYYRAEVVPLSMTNRRGGGRWSLLVWRPRVPGRVSPSADAAMRARISQPAGAHRGAGDRAAPSGVAEARASTESDR